jgi:Tfp pilus assembly protein PilX
MVLTISADDSDALLAIAGAEAQLGRGEQAVDDHVVGANAAIHEF